MRLTPQSSVISATVILVSGFFSSRFFSDCSKARFVICDISVVHLRYGNIPRRGALPPAPERASRPHRVPQIFKPVVNPKETFAKEPPGFIRNRRALFFRLILKCCPKCCHGAIPGRKSPAFSRLFSLSGITPTRCRDS